MHQLSDNYTTPIVNKDFKGLRIDKFLNECFADISRSQAQKLIEAGRVLCDEVTIADNAYKIKEGEAFTVSLPDPIEAIP